MFANQLKKLRLSKELNQVQLAEKLDVTKQTVSNWENDNIMPSVEMLEKLADYFCVSTDYLLGRHKEFVGNVLTMDITGLNPTQVEHVQAIVDAFRASNL